MTLAITIVILCVSIGLAAQVVRYPCRQVDGPIAIARGQVAVFGGLVVAGSLLGPAGLVLAGLGAYARSVMRRRRRHLQREQQIRTGLAEVVDLFAVSLASGHNLYAATDQVARWSRDPFSAAFASCVSAVDLGQPLSDSLEQVPRQLGLALQPLVGALVAHDRYGAPISQNLAALAGECRRTQRHQAEVLARRLPVTLLGPLVVCVLPAFLLLTVVPLVVDTVGSFAETLGA